MSEQNQNYEARIAALEDRLDHAGKAFEILQGVVSEILQFQNEQVRRDVSNSHHSSNVSLNLLEIVTGLTNDQLAVDRYLGSTANVPDADKRRFLDAVARRESAAEQIELLLAKLREKLTNRPPPPPPPGA